MFTDTHCHIFSLEYDNYEEILINLEKNNIKRILINGYDLESNQEVLKLVKKYPNVYGALGIHPNYIEDNLDNTIEFIKDHINRDKIIAVGEIGLDYYRNEGNNDKQIELFNRMLNLADENNKPVIIHNRDATGDIITILKNYNLKGIIHCFSGSIETANEYIKLGYKLGINGILTFKNSNLGNVLSQIKLENMLLETDAPYLSPEPVRKGKNEPKNIFYTATKLAEICHVEIDALAQKLEENFHDTFDI